MYPRVLLTALAIAALCSWPACAPRRKQIPLSAMQWLQVQYQEGPRGWLVARMGADERSMVAGPDCPFPAPDATASLNGAPLKRMRGWVVGDEMAYYRDCIIELAFPGPMEKQGRARSAFPQNIAVPTEIEGVGSVPQAARVSGPTTLRIEQSATSRVFTILDGFAPRTLVLVSPKDGVLAPGQTVTVRWQPATDRIAQDHVALSLQRRGRRVLSPDDVTIKSAELSFQGNDITFTAPGTLPEALHGECEIQFLGSAWVKPGTGPCPVNRCDMEMIFDAPSVPVQVR
jgi:hypothetical protein